MAELEAMGPLCECETQQKPCPSDPTEDESERIRELLALTDTGCVNSCDICGSEYIQRDFDRLTVEELTELLEVSDRTEQRALEAR